MKISDLTDDSIRCAIYESVWAAARHYDTTIPRVLFFKSTYDSVKSSPLRISVGHSTKDSIKNLNENK